MIKFLFYTTEIPVLRFNLSTLPDYRSAGAYKFRRKKGVDNLLRMEWTSTVNTSPLQINILGTAVVFKTETEFSVVEKIFISEILYCLKIKRMRRWYYFYDNSQFPGIFFW
jgi:hypothetical protein